MRKRLRKASERGQVLAEYAIMLAMFAVLAGIMVLLFAVFTEYGWRILSFVAWEPFVGLAWSPTLL